jgi:hypothetical protein
VAIEEGTRFGGRGHARMVLPRKRC